MYWWFGVVSFCRESNGDVVAVGGVSAYEHTPHTYNDESDYSIISKWSTCTEREREETSDSETDRKLSAVPPQPRERFLQGEVGEKLCHDRSQRHMFTPSKNASYVVTLQLTF